MDSYITVKETAEFRFEDRKSVFIGYATPINTEEDALDFISLIKKKYPDARHWVYAYVLRENSIMRFTDDREPQGTAGMPVLDVIRKSGCTDTLIVVVRYFGGVLLGTGGLVHAYTESALGALKAATVIRYDIYSNITLNLSYSDYQKIMPVISAFDFLVDNTEYMEEVKVYGNLLKDNAMNFIDKITEVTSGRCGLKIMSEKYDYR
jgi:uncharacterized YigZ family protein